MESNSAYASARLASARVISRRILIASLDGARAVTVKEAMRRYLAEAVRESCGGRARAQPVD